MTEPNNNNKSWASNEIVLLIKHYENNVEPSKIADELGRSRRAIISKANKLHIAHPVSFTEKECRYIKKNYNSYNLQEISNKLCRPKTSIARKARELGVEMTGRKKKNPKGPAKPKYKTSKARNAATSKRMKKWIAENGHPRGMLGKTHSEEFKKRYADAVIKWHQNASEKDKKKRIDKLIKSRKKNGTLNPHKDASSCYSRARGGRRADLNNQYFRSAWEANMARYYNFVGIRWEYEPRTFVFEPIRRGCVSYTPDFYLLNEDRWVEIKGWMDDKSKTKLKRFAKYYPEESKKLELITQKEYKEFAKYGRLIPNWE
jgi:hypothetical protein